MPYIKEAFGRMPGGELVHKYTLKNRNGLTAGFLDLGAVWQSMLVPDRSGNFADVVLGYDSTECYLASDAHLGEIIGRNANRIGGGHFELNGRTYTLTINNGPNNLHSGNDFYRNRLWKARAWEQENESSVCFTLESPDGDQGFPGNLNISVTYTLNDQDELHICYRGISDADTVMNMTNHAYFNLAGHQTGDAMGQWVTYTLNDQDELHICYRGISDADTVMNMTNHAYFNLAGHQTGDAMGQWIFLNAEQFTPADEVSIPYGTVVSVKGTPMDFTEGKEIRRDLESAYDQLVKGNGYDHNWVIKREGEGLALAAKAWAYDQLVKGNGYDHNWVIKREGEGLALAAKAWDKLCGRGMEVWTDMPGLQFYTANYLDDSLPGKNGAVYRARHGYCFETQYYPDAVNHPQFPSPVIKAGIEKLTETVYRFYTE